MDKLASEILEDAIVVLDERGHCKEVFEDSEGQVCAIGAIRHASYGSSYHVNNEYYYNLAMAAEFALADVLDPTRRLGVPLWNDLESTTKQDVQDKMMEAAKVLRNRGE